jgi:hypothetical protein
MPEPLLKQIDDELQAIQKKLRDGSGTGSDLGALVATLLANEATTNAVVDTLTTNVDTSAALLVTLLDSADAGIGIGPVASFAADLTQDLVALIAQEP